MAADIAYPAIAKAARVINDQQTVLFIMPLYKIKLFIVSNMPNVLSR
jgi:hypothetical protein